MNTDLIFNMGLDLASRRSMPVLENNTSILMTQSYFWTEDWQKGEWRATLDIDAGRITWPDDWE